jgi:hypothetical protein
MKNNYFMRIVIVGSLLSLPIEAKHPADAQAYDSWSAERGLNNYRTNYLDKTLAWTDKKFNDLKRSIYKHPLRYVAGLTAAVALIGVGIYAFKLKPAALPVAPIMPSIPSSLSTEAIEPIAAVAQASSLPVHIASAVSQQETPQQFLRSLRTAVEGDLFKVACMKETRQFGKIDLESFKQITSTNHVAELHAGLKTVKEAFMFVAGYAAKETLNEAEIASLHGCLESLRASIQESLPLYN